MWSLRGSLIYTAFATALFLLIQYLDDVRDPVVLAVTALTFFFFTFAMLRLIQRVLGIVGKGMGPGRRGRRGQPEREPGPAEVEPTTTRPEHVRRRRERRRRR